MARLNMIVRSLQPYRANFDDPAGVLPRAPSLQMIPGKIQAVGLVLNGPRRGEAPWYRKKALRLDWKLNVNER